MIYELLMRANNDRSEEKYESESILSEIIDISPFFDHAYEELASIYEKRGDIENEIKTRLKLEKFVPGLSRNRFSLGRAYMREGHLLKARQLFDQGLNSPMTCEKDRMLPYGYVSSARIKHDMAQIQWLVTKNKISTKYLDLLNYYEDCLKIKDKSSDGVWKLPVDLLLNISPFYRRCLHISENDVRGAMFNEEINWYEIEQNMSSNQVEDRVVVVDNFLSQECYKELWNFCLFSTIWHNDSQKGKGYIGAYRHNGFSSPLIERIGAELKSKLSNTIITNLSQIWAYRNVEGTEGIGIHADDSCINVNLWMTPAIANNGDDGGLIVYNKAAPLDWTFNDYNFDQQKILSAIEGCDRKIINYKENRAVIFDSSLFHGSHNPLFGNQLDEMRLNITFLYGQR